MPPFIFINDININNNYQAIEELNIRETNNKKFDSTIKHAITAFTKLLNSIPKE